MSLEHICAVPYLGADFVVACDGAFTIKDAKVNGRWWPAREVLSPALLAALQAEVLAMPSNTEEA